MIVLRIKENIQVIAKLSIIDAQSKHSHKKETRVNWRRGQEKHFELC